MKTHVLMCFAIALTGCTALDRAGTAEYSIKPFVVDKEAGKLACCEITVKNGKEIARLRAEIRKTGEDFVLVFEENGVKAFEGQALTATAWRTGAESVGAALGQGLKVNK